MMRIQKIIFLLILVIGCVPLTAENQTFFETGKCATFFLDGNMIIDTVDFMSSRSGRLGFVNSGMFKIINIWMVNFISNEWNFPEEREELAPTMDTLFLRNGGIIRDRIDTYSTKMKVFRFDNTAPIHISQIKRIYFCCNKLPKSFEEKLKTGSAVSYYTFMIDGRVIDSPIVYLENVKTGFGNGLQVNTKDIVMINFENNQADFPNEKRMLSRTADSIFLEDNNVIYKNIAKFSHEEGIIEFQDSTQIPFSKITRIYFYRLRFESESGKERIIKRE
jgi:hypothetical protein